MLSMAFDVALRLMLMRPYLLKLIRQKWGIKKVGMDNMVIVMNIPFSLLSG